MCGIEQSQSDTMSARGAILTTVMWFRQDLRTRDNPALAAAAARGKVLPVYIFEEGRREARPLGTAARWWLHQSLAALRADLGELALFKGDPCDLLPMIIGRTGASAVYWTRCYEPHEDELTRQLQARLHPLGAAARCFSGNLLHEPGDLLAKSGGPFKVFTPFWRACLARRVAAPARRPRLDLVTTAAGGDRLADWRLPSAAGDRAAGWEKLWRPGEKGALERLDEFLQNGLARYGERRDRPDVEGTSRLSPHLRWGEVSPRLIWLRLAREREAASPPAGVAKFQSEIGWREFAYHLLFHFPTLPSQNWRDDFDAFPWRDDQGGLAAWQQGRTGYPMVDAGMRELWHTGWMHNRVRMIVASFLVKHLQIDWRRGEAWFWDGLLDADLANNAAGWQWVAGSGADAAPFFRIFNPVAQGRKFDPQGDYVRRWCPELARLSDARIHAPFEASAAELAEAGVVLGQTYPFPVIDHARARQAALAAYARMRAARR